MIDLRTLLLAIVLGCGPAVASAQTASPLANIDRELNTLCERLPKAGTDGAAIWSRLAVLWREREAVLARLPAERRAAELHGAAVSPQCLRIANAAAVEPRPVVPGATVKATTPVPKNGTVERMERAPASVDKRIEELSKAMKPSVIPLGETHARSAASPSISGPRAPDTSPPVGGGAAPQLEDFFPWPPPAPSDRLVFPLKQLVTSTTLTTFGDLADYIESVLRKGDFKNWAYFRAPNGFALVTPIEALDATGQVLRSEARWSQNLKLASSLSFWQLLTLNERPVGRYRFFIFFTTPDPAVGARLSGEQIWTHAVDWANTGLAFLPSEVRRISLTPDHHLIAHVYEFERTLAGETNLAEHGQWTMSAHFQSAGIAIATRP